MIEQETATQEIYLEPISKFIIRARPVQGGPAPPRGTDRDRDTGFIPGVAPVLSVPTKRHKISKCPIP